MSYFRHSLAIFHIVGAPVRKRIHVKIIPVQIDSFTLNKRISPLDYPLENLRVAQVNQSYIPCTQQPPRLIIKKPGAGGSALWFKPYDAFYAALAPVISN